MTESSRELNNDELDGVAGGKLKIGVPINARLQAIVDDAKKNGQTLEETLAKCGSDIERTFVRQNWSPNPRYNRVTRIAH